MRYEPAVLIAAIAVILQSAVLFGWAPKDLDTMELAQALVVLITLLAGLFTRQHVVPVKRLRDAGIHTKMFKD